MATVVIGTKQKDAFMKKVEKVSKGKKAKKNPKKTFLYEIKDELVSAKEKGLTYEELQELIKDTFKQEVSKGTLVNFFKEIKKAKEQNDIGSITFGDIKE